MTDVPVITVDPDTNHWTITYPPSGRPDSFECTTEVLEEFIAERNRLIDAVRDLETLLLASPPPDHDH